MCKTVMSEVAFLGMVFLWLGLICLPLISGNAFLPFFRQQRARRSQRLPALLEKASPVNRLTQERRSGFETSTKQGCNSEPCHSAQGLPISAMGLDWNSRNKQKFACAFIDKFGRLLRKLV